MATMAERDELRRALEDARRELEAVGALGDVREALDAARTTLRETKSERERLNRECAGKRRELGMLEREIERRTAVVKESLAQEVARVRSARDAPKTDAAEVTAHKAEIEAEARRALERALEARFRADLEAARSQYESNLNELRLKLTHAAAAKDDAESEAASLKRRCDALDERLARDRMALLDATSALETRGQLIATLRRRIESLEAREHEARMELKLHMNKERKWKFDDTRRREVDASIDRIEAAEAVTRNDAQSATAAATPSDVQLVTAAATPSDIQPAARSHSFSSRRAALQDIRLELADLSQ